MARHTNLALALAALALSLTGCVSPGNYLGNRAADLADVFTAELTIGPGFDVHAQATALVGTALGYSPQRGLMMHGRFVGTGERHTGGIVLSAATSISGEFLDPLYGDAVYRPRDRSWFLLIRYPPFVPAFRKGELMRLLDVEAGASAIVGVHLGVSPLELVDFLLGLATVDLAGDDYRPRHVQPPGTPLVPPPTYPSTPAVPGAGGGT